MYEKIESSKMSKVAKNKEMERYPGCNIEYVRETQKSKVWCTTLRLGHKEYKHCLIILYFN